MSNYRLVSDYRTELRELGKSRFLVANPAPVLITANPENESGPGYFTRPNTRPKLASLSTSNSYALRLGFNVTDGYLVIPVVKAEGRPFPDRIGVGRTRGTDIVVPSSEASKYHAYFTSEAERWFLTDASSSNGTFIDGNRLTPMTPVQLADGSLLAFGSRLFLFRTASGFCDLLTAQAEPVRRLGGSA